VQYTTLGRLRQRWRAAQRLFDSGALDESVRTLPRWQRDDSLPGELLRPHAHKQQLREEEEDELELVSARLAGRVRVPGSARAWVCSLPLEARVGLREALQLAK
jgi:hypothetical protein